MISDQALAGAMGYLSIAFWLCAQLPQVIKNAGLKSCEGLSLPFLVNWLAGDITNFIGCVLTDQLPFQTWLAGYFCVIDFTLCWQYYIYRKPKAVSIHPPYSSYTPGYTPSASVHASLILPPRSSSRPGTGRIRTTSNQTVRSLTSANNHHHTPDTAVSERSNSTARPHMRRNPTTHGSSSTLDSPGIYTDGSYAALYEAALDVARAAERVNARRSESRRRRLSRQNTTTAREDGADHMIESFHSDMSTRTSSTTMDEADYGRMSASTSVLPDHRDGRGRSLRRAVNFETSDSGEEVSDQPTPLAAAHTIVEGQYLEHRSHKRDKSRSLSLARGSSGRGGRRAAGVTFMSLGLLARGWYATGMGSTDLTPIPARHSSGVVLSNPSHDLDTSYRHPPIHPISPRPSVADYTYVYFTDHPEHPDHPDRSHKPIPDGPPNFQRIVGRMSAWCCTTLYLTSRLPQIWKNFNRKSVEGLSIFLFLFAFCGNLAYVMSILIDPSGKGDPSEAGHYLLEALPYLLGSGGTLMFDFTIMFQSWMYGSAPPIFAATHRKLRLPGRRRARHVEDTPKTASTSTERGERAPLLVAQPKSPHSRDRSLSPEVVIRFIPASVPDHPDRE